MDYIDILFNLFEKKILRVFNKLDILKINSIYSWYDVEKNLLYVLFFQQCMDIVIRYSNYKKINEEAIIKGFENINSRDNLDLEKKIILNWLDDDKIWIETAWYNDASASVIQLLSIKLMTTQDFALKLANIFDNDTEFKDIYDYVLKNIVLKNSKYAKIVSRELIKRIIMPGIYGQRTITMIQRCEKLIQGDLEYKDEGKKNILLEIDKLCWKILEEIDIPLKDYLNKVKRYGRISKKFYWFSMINQPILIGKYKEIDRKKEIIKIKKLLIEKKVEKIDMLKNKLNLDDMNYLRKNIKTGRANNYIKIRIKKRGGSLDTGSLENGICPSSAHSEDASILILILEECRKLGLGVIPIHDSIGSKIYFSCVLKVLYKESFIKYIDYSLSEKEFPIREIIKLKEFEDFKVKWENRRKVFVLNKKKIINNIRKSRNIFN